MDTSQSYLDGFVGARHSLAMSKQWDFAVRGDVGTGGTQFT